MAPPPPAPPAIEPKEHGHGPPPRRAAELGEDQRARAVDQHSALVTGLAVAARPRDPVRDLLQRLCEDRATSRQHATQRRRDLFPGRDRSIFGRDGTMPEPALPTVLAVLELRGAEQAE